MLARAEGQRYRAGWTASNESPMQVFPDYSIQGDGTDRWLVYELPPIDNWQGMLLVEQYLLYTEVWNQDQRTSIHAMLRSARKAASQAGWEGDTTTGPFVVPLPAWEDFADTWEAAFIWKQSNNGAVYLVSRIEFPCYREFLVQPS